MKAVQLGYDHAKEHLPCPLPAARRAHGQDPRHIMIDGNTGGRLGCVLCRRDRGPVVSDHAVHVPDGRVSKASAEAARRPGDRQEQLRGDPGRGRTLAIGMVLGANWNGARAFTATSGPGISLMNEFIGLAYYAEVPAVLFDVQRVGPSTGMPSAPSSATC